MITPERAARCSFRDVGYDAMTYGSIGHHLGMIPILFLPRSLMQTIFMTQANQMNEFSKDKT